MHCVRAPVDISFRWVDRCGELQFPMDILRLAPRRLDALVVESSHSRIPSVSWGVAACTSWASGRGRMWRPTLECCWHQGALPLLQDREAQSTVAQSAAISSDSDSSDADSSDTDKGLVQPPPKPYTIPTSVDDESDWSDSSDSSMPGPTPDVRIFGGCHDGHFSCVRAFSQGHYTQYQCRL